MVVSAGFEAFAAKMRAEDLPAVAIETFRHYHDLLRSGESGLLPESAIEPVESLPDSDE